MPRKTQPLGPVDSKTDNEPQPQLQPPPPAGEKRRPGRPSNAERQAREQRATITEHPSSAGIAIKPAEMLGVTAVVLGIIARGIRGDKPTDAEIAMVNDPLTAVANKYQIVSRWAPELALLGSLIVVASSMRGRARDRIEAEERARMLAQAERAVV